MRGDRAVGLDHREVESRSDCPQIALHMEKRSAASKRSVVAAGSLSRPVNRTLVSPGLAPMPNDGPVAESDTEA